MAKAKTHFEQVPLEAMKKIVEEKTKQELEAERGRTIKTKKWEKKLLHSVVVGG